jgi:hypothetical protein
VPLTLNRAAAYAVEISLNEISFSISHANASAAVQLKLFELSGAQPKSGPLSGNAANVRLTMSTTYLPSNALPPSLLCKFTCGTQVMISAATLPQAGAQYQCMPSYACLYLPISPYVSRRRAGSTSACRPPSARHALTAPSRWRQPTCRRCTRARSTSSGISPYVSPISPYISPISPYISLYLTISHYISLYLPEIYTGALDFQQCASSPTLARAV